MEKKRKLESESESNDTSEPSQKIAKEETEIVNEEEAHEVEDDNNTVEEASSDSDEEPIEDLLEPFTKDQMIHLLKQAAAIHPDISNQIRTMADEDPVHRKIFVHGLGWDTKADSLIEGFRQYGEIEDCKLVVDKITGQSKGYGFILFKSRAGARHALKQPQKKIGTRMTACQLASIGPVNNNNNTVTAVVASSGGGGPHFNPEHVQRKIYVSNVSSDLDPEKLFMFFEKYGEIEEGPLGLDKATGRPKGYTLFVYKSAESAKKALEEPRKMFEGHILQCHKANDGPKPIKQYQQQHQQQHYSQNTRYQRNENVGYVGHGGSGHYIGGVGGNNNQGAAQGLNSAIGQAAITALLASQGAGLGLNQAFVGQALLGSLGTAASPGGVAGMPGGYGSQGNVAPVGFPGYGGQGGYQGQVGGYQTPQQPGQGGAGRGGQYGVGGYGGHYMGQ